MARERTGASSFDELAVGLSSGKLSRGKALKLMGARWHPLASVRLLPTLRSAGATASLAGGTGSAVAATAPATAAALALLALVLLTWGSGAWIVIAAAMSGQLPFKGAQM